MLQQHDDRWENLEKLMQGRHTTAALSVEHKFSDHCGPFLPFVAQNSYVIGTSGVCCEHFTQQPFFFLTLVLSTVDWPLISFDWHQKYDCYCACFLLELRSAHGAVCPQMINFAGQTLPLAKNSGATFSKSCIRLTFEFWSIDVQLWFPSPSLQEGDFVPPGICLRALKLQTHCITQVASFLEPRI